MAAEGGQIQKLNITEELLNIYNQIATAYATPANSPYTKEAMLGKVMETQTAVSALGGECKAILDKMAADDVPSTIKSHFAKLVRLYCILQLILQQFQSKNLMVIATGDIANMISHALADSPAWKAAADKHNIKFPPAGLPDVAGTPPGPGAPPPGGGPSSSGGPPPSGGPGGGPSSSGGPTPQAPPPPPAILRPGSRPPPGERPPPREEPGASGSANFPPPPPPPGAAAAVPSGRRNRSNTPATAGPVPEPFPGAYPGTDGQGPPTVTTGTTTTTEPTRQDSCI